MAYATTGILGIMILVIINQDVLWKSNQDVVPAEGAYRIFLFGVLAYYVTDVLWGVLDDMGLTAVLFADTTVYFAVMSLSVFLWSRYVSAYLDTAGRASSALLYVGSVFLVLGIVIVVVNLFTPILFWFDESGAYVAGPARYLLLGLQIVMYLLTSLYAFWVMSKTEGATKRRHWAIGLFGVAMTALIAIQIFYPLLPLYSVGYMIGICVLHTFVVEDEKEEYRRALEETIKRELQKEEELGSAKRLAYTDPLTGIKNKHAYTEAEARLNQRIADGDVKEFAIVVFDLNGLKAINDTLGHEAGDHYIISACKLICNEFKHSPVFRVGGDEFAAILEGEDYQNRMDLLASFNWQAEQNHYSGDTVVSAGVAEFDPGIDSGCWTVFDRADAEMYRQKGQLKGLDEPA